jgi:hypothetical protein
MKTTGTMLPAIVMCVCVMMMSCAHKQGRDLVVDNEKPKYSDNDYYVFFQKKYSLDVTRINMFSKDSEAERTIAFDSNNNIYILDVYEGIIYVYDENGIEVKAFSRKGQGPNEIMDPYFLFIKNDILFVFQNPYMCKRFKLDGSFISQFSFVPGNHYKIQSVGDRFYLFSGKTDRTFKKLEFILESVDENISDGKTLFRCEYPPGLGAPYYDFRWYKWLAITDNGEFYFPEDNLNKYSIVKRDKEGKQKIIIKRPYKITRYSKEAHDRFDLIYQKEVKNGTRKFPEYPPVIRLLFEDMRKNLWVISGETTEDNGSLEYENVIDIFSNKGEWLKSFKSKILSRYCFYHKGKIYKIMPMDTGMGKQYIDVYEIKY